MHVIRMLRWAWYFSDEYELVGMLDAVHNSLEGAENQDNWIRVQCMYGVDWII